MPSVYENVYGKFRAVVKLADSRAMKYKNVSNLTKFIQYMNENYQVQAIFFYYKDNGTKAYWYNKKSGLNTW